MSFSDTFRNAANRTYTENGALAHKTTGNKVLDLFARIGGMRNESEQEIINAFDAARNEDKELADNMVLYARNVRDGGIGERRIGRILIRHLAAIDPAKVERNFDTIVNAGRWDDLFILEGTTIENEMMDFVKKQFLQDVLDAKKGKPISLLMKWLPSINTSSKESRRLARKFASYFGINEKTYRKALSKLRGYLKVVEKDMSAQEFDKIEYSAVPSVAMTRYRHAFGVHDFERFDKYLKSVQKGEAKINASVSYPYELVRPYIKGGAFDKVLEAQWEALPNYVEGNHNVIVMADVSGSMTCNDYRPMATSTSLAAYFAEHNTGAYKDMFLTFTDVPNFFTLNSTDSIYNRIREVRRHVGYNTNLDGALFAVYNMACEANEAPDALVIISDMEIDLYVGRIGMTKFEDLIEKWERKYGEAGLKMPKLIFWNVESRGAKYLGKCSNPNVAFISGSSASTFKELTTLITMDAVEAMIAILTKPQFTWK